MKINKPVRTPQPVNNEGTPVPRINAEQQLRRLTATAMLWEDGFYVDGKTVAAMIADLIPQCRPDFVAACAFEARDRMKLRHVPLLIAREMARGPVPHRLMVAKLLPDIIQRADELTEFLAIYWKDNPDQPISAQVKKGLARAFNKFDEYALAKYNRDGAVKLRDVAFLTHVKPANPDLVARLVNKDKIPTYTKGGNDVNLSVNQRVSLGAKVTEHMRAFYPNPGLKTPDTWEVELSASQGEDKKGSWERLLREQKLGGLAWLRNLRNMAQAGVSERLIKEYAETVNMDRVLPFRFLAAARIMPQFESFLEPLMLKACEGREKLKGRTIILVDVSPSMRMAKVSAKSDLTRQDAAYALAILAREVCEEVEILAFASAVGEVPPRRGFALGDAIAKATPSNGTLLGKAIGIVNGRIHDRLIVISDEESQDPVGAPKARQAYMINVASSKNGVGYGVWNHIDGWSEAVLDYIEVFEAM